MLCDIFRRVWPFGRVEDYIYVGFGSVWFADFSLFHRALGIKDMVSIESAKGSQARIEENKPFRIPVIYQHSKDALPKLDWSRKQFLWLDYDDPIATDMLYDMQTVARNCPSGTLLAVSVQCSLAPEVPQAEQDKAADALSALDRFIGRFGRQRFEQAVSPDDLYGWRFGALSRKILLDEIYAGIAARNSSSNLEIKFRLICEIEYEDGAKMTTLVGMLYSSADENLLQECRFDSLDFIPTPLSPIRVEVPKLTIREFKRLESQLPLGPDQELLLGSIPEKEAKNFKQMYRYLPSFAVLEG